MTGKYRINAATLVLVLDSEYHRRYTVPRGAIVTVDRTTFGTTKMVQITWDGKKAMMFLQDLRSRGEQIEERMSA